MGVLAVRFGLGAAALLALFRQRMTGFLRKELLAGVLIGIVTFASYAMQTEGLRHIPSSRSAFITAMYVPVVPLLQVLIVGRAPALSARIGIVISFAGLLILSSGSDFTLELTYGDALTLGGALAAALQIVLVSRFAPDADPMRLTCVQLATVGILAGLAVPILGEPLPAPTLTFLSATLALGLLGTALALGAMAWAQQTVPATRATLIYALEPVWAGVFGAVAGEVLSARTLAGSGLIVLGVVVSGVRWSRLASQRRSNREGIYE
jgi:drug/metabolite transporter (DMT)-like permease